jgi:hypothetical protein
MRIRVKEGCYQRMIKVGLSGLREAWKGSE